MTQEEFKQETIEIHSDDNFIFWTPTLPKTARLATKIDPFRIYEKIYDKFKNNEGIIYFEKSINNVYYIVSIKDYTSPERLLGYIMKELIYY